MELPRTKKSLGQHWLTDVACLTAMADAAEVGADDVVLEIGPGAGTLTSLLCERAARVIAVELDDDLVVSLPAAVPSKKLEVVHSNILQFDLTSLPQDYKVVANIPYYLTSNLIRVLSESVNSPSQVALLVQKEVAQRVAADPGDMSLLSVTAQYYWEVELHRMVPAALFTPPPKVDSQILALHRRPVPLFPDIDATAFFRLVKAGFAERRKKLRSSLSGGLRLEKPAIDQLLAKAGVDGELRPQALSLDDWYKLYKVVHELA